MGRSQSRHCIFPFNSKLTLLLLLLLILLLLLHHLLLLLHLLLILLLPLRFTPLAWDYNYLNYLANLIHSYQGQRHNGASHSMKPPTLSLASPTQIFGILVLSLLSCWVINTPPSQPVSSPSSREWCKTNWSCSVPWKHQLAMMTSEVFPAHVLNMEFLYHPWFQALLFLTPLNHSRSPFQAWAGRERRMEWQSGGLSLPYSSLPSPVTDFWPGCRSYQGSIKLGGLWPERGG